MYNLLPATKLAMQNRKCRLKFTGIISYVRSSYSIEIRLIKIISSSPNSLYQRKQMVPQRAMNLYRKPFSHCVSDNRSSLPLPNFFLPFPSLTSNVIE